MTQQPSAGRYFILGFVIICAIIFVDQYTKWLIMEAVLRPEGPTNVSFLNWAMTQKQLEIFINEKTVPRFPRLLLQGQGY